MGQAIFVPSGLEATRTLVFSRWEILAGGDWHERGLKRTDTALLLCPVLAASELAACCTPVARSPLASPGIEADQVALVIHVHRRDSRGKMGKRRLMHHELRQVA